MMLIKIKPLASLFAAMLLAGCAGLGGLAAVEAPTGEASRELLVERVAAFWKHMENKNWESAYDYYDPFFRAATSRRDFVRSRLDAISYYNSSVGEVLISGRIADVRVPIEVEIKDLMVAPRRFQSGPRQPRVLEVRWLWIDENWYAQYLSPQDSQFANH